MPQLDATAPVSGRSPRSRSACTNHYATWMGSPISSSRLMSATLMVVNFGSSGRTHCCTGAADKGALHDEYRGRPGQTGKMIMFCQCRPRPCPGRRRSVRFGRSAPPPAPAHVYPCGWVHAAMILPSRGGPSIGVRPISTQAPGATSQHAQPIRRLRKLKISLPYLISERIRQADKRADQTSERIRQASGSL